MPDDAGVHRELLRVNRENRGLQNVIVWLAAEESMVKEKEPAASGSPALMDQHDYEFVPRVLAVRSGQPVKFSNSDAANHNVRASSVQPTNEFNVFTGVDGSYTRSFVADVRQRPVRLGCDIHPWMRGWIYVFDHARFAVTDDLGRFQISSVPVGKYKLVIQQPDVRYEHEREITVSNSVEIAIDIRAENLPGEKSHL